MKSVKKVVLYATAALVAGAAGSVHADVLQYKFSQANGQVREVLAENRYINPDSFLDIYASAGTDRKVKITILRKDTGAEVESKTSELLGFNSKIVVDSKSYYGAILRFNSPSEGTFVARQDTLSSANKIVQTTQTEFVVDRTPPRTGEWFWSVPYGGGIQGDGIPKFGTTEARNIGIKDVQDASGISSINFKTEVINGPKTGLITNTGDVGYNESLKEAIIGGANVNDLFDKAFNSLGANSKNKITFFVTDKAGNSSSSSMIFHNDSICPATPIPVGYYDPAYGGNLYGVQQLKGYREITGSFNLPQNPGSFIYRSPRSQSKSATETQPYGGYFVADAGGVISHSVIHSDSNYVYYKIDGVINPDKQFGDFLRWNSDGFWVCDDVRLPQANFTASTTPPHNKIKQEFDIAGYGRIQVGFKDIPGRTIPRDTKMTGIAVEVEPRPYVQRVMVAQQTCDVPANQKSCYINTNTPWNVTGEVVMYQYLSNVSRLDMPGMVVPAGYITLAYDGEDPIFQRFVSHDSFEKKVSVEFFEGNSGSLWGTVNLPHSGLRFVDKSGKETIFNHESVVSGNNKYTFTTSYKGLPPGQYDVYAWATDNWGNTAAPSPKLFTIANDTTKPVIKIISSGSGVTSLDDITFTVNDETTAKPRVTSIKLEGGPTKDTVYLTARSLGLNYYGLEYPIMFPSLEQGESYTLTVQGVDDQGNIGEASFGFDYTPRQITMSPDASGILSIPALAAEFRRASGKEVIDSNPVTMRDGTVVSGRYDIMATLRKDAKVPLKVNGFVVEPGQTVVVMPAHDFASTGGKISLSVSAAVDGQTGTSNLLVTTSAPNSPVLIANINVWKPAGKLTGTSASVRQGIDVYTTNAVNDAANGSRCALSTDESRAKTADPITAPVCLLGWDKIPEGDYQSTEKDKSTINLQGRASKLGSNDMTFALYMYASNGTKYLVGNGSGKLNVTSPMGSVKIATITDLSKVTRRIQEIDTRVKQVEGPVCLFVQGAEKAALDASTKMNIAASPSCWVEWTKLPVGLSQAERVEVPLLQGNIPNKGATELKWKISMFSKSGQQIVLNEQSQPITVVDPSVPTVEITSPHVVNDSLLVVPHTGGYVGDVTITSERSQLDVSIMRGTDVLESGVAEPSRFDKSQLYRRIDTDERPLWTETPYTVNVNYTLLPEVKTKKVYRIVAGPSLGMRPVVSVNSNQAVDTEAMKVKVTMSDRYKPAEAYNANMGKWKVRLVKLMTYNKREPMTDYVETVDGVATFNVGLDNVNAASVRFIAEAVLVSPIEGYKRTEESTVPTFITVLRGNAIGASVTGRRLSGEAPFVTAFKLALDEALDMRAVGAVVWEVSSNRGSSWEKIVQPEQRKMMFMRTFEKGEYKVRAKITNINSAKEKYTEIVDVIAYDKPKLELTGAQQHFIGSKATMSAKFKFGKDYISKDRVVIEWSKDGGKTYAKGTDTFQLTSAKEARIKLSVRARSIDAPGSDAYAFDVVNKSIDFLPVKPPRPYVTGPSRIELGKTYTFNARITPPYPSMDVKMAGAFTLPNGKVVNGESATYTPTAADLSAERVETKYTAWVDGYRNQGAEGTHSMRSRVWEYVFPSFGLQIRKSANVSPVQITLTVRPIAFEGTLESPTYDWNIPASATVLDDKFPTLRTFVLNSTGAFDVGVVVRDARGNVAKLKETILIGEAAPYSVEVKYSGSNPINRAPLSVLLRPYVTGGHPQDRILTREFFVNGEKLNVTGFYGRTVLQAGEHDIQYKVVSQMGSEATAKLNISVKENQPPTCTMSSRETVGSWLFYASCKDEDGRMKTYEWTVDGEVKAVTGDRLTLNRSGDARKPNVQLIGIDDAGGRSQPAALQ
ncbi:Ig-like domain-containing protein [Comamonas testosteroni]|uniref:Ig-like domain-containing protein n=1 Tax=Comamonas testosteroni TaxID=285 RepID=UPI000AED685B|nr:Ig-like domain-containing protein [Comamonas testosteroni]WKL18771.1 Ig-like domain-containing protein [Comamonas testosteroni]